MTTKYFYQDLDSFSNFLSVADDSYFKTVPRDWLVIVTDVKSSTKAIEEGRYKDVNLIGAASIVAAHNVMLGLSFPYVFGGDGAIFLIHPEYEKRMRRELSTLKSLSLAKFGLSLRIGVVKVSEIFDSGSSITVAKFAPDKNKAIAVFRGGGISLADKKVKENEEEYSMEEAAKYNLNLSDLSCRWKPIPSKRGIVISLLIVTRDDSDPSTYKNIIRSLRHIYQGNLESANPVNDDGLEYKDIIACYQSEKRLHRRPYLYIFFRRLISIVLSYFFLNKDNKWNKKYKSSMKTHSDYRKFDDMLRMVIDCTDIQSRLINKLLEKLYERGDIFYGIHESKHSLMTCYVKSIEDEQHIHFIDGDNGGYAMAAKKLKDQIKASKGE